MQTNTIVALGLGAVILVGATAAGSVYLAKQSDTPPVAEKTVVVREHPQHRVEQHPAQPATVACNDGNIAGKVVGGVGGGIAGSMIGKGNGKTAATVAGALGGAYLGGEAIPLNGVTCRQ